MSGVIEAKGFTLNYGKVTALNNVRIDLNENQLIGLIGRNGSGKTTFMKVIAGLLEPTEGEILVLNQKPMDNIEVLSEVIYSYSNIPHYELSTLQAILDNFQMFYSRFDMTFANKLLEFFSLKPTMKYKSLSQGLTSAFNFICALSTRAKITLLDEPILGMDVAVRKKVYEILLRDYMEYPRNFIISSHILSELDDFLSEILLIDKGNIIFYKEIEEVSSMAYRVDGPEDAVKTFSKTRPMIYEKYNTMGSYAIIESKFDDLAKKESIAANLSISKVRPADLCIYKTIGDGEADLECLWEK